MLLPVCLLMLTMLPGCVINHGDFTVMSNKLMRLSEFDLSKADRKKGIRGEDVSHIIILFPTKAQVTLEEAVDDALTKGDGDVMTDVKVKQWGWYIPYIYGQTGWSVVGGVTKTRHN